MINLSIMAMLSRPDMISTFPFNGPYSYTLTLTTGVVSQTETN